MKGLDCYSGEGGPIEQSVVDWGSAAVGGEKRRMDIDAAIESRGEDAVWDETAKGDGYNKVYRAVGKIGRLWDCQ